MHEHLQYALQHTGCPLFWSIQLQECEANRFALHFLFYRKLHCKAQLLPSPRNGSAISDNAEIFAADAEIFIRGFRRILTALRGTYSGPGWS